MTPLSLIVFKSANVAVAWNKTRMTVKKTILKDILSWGIIESGIAGFLSPMGKY
jgi:hypothetical protein